MSPEQISAARSLRDVDGLSYAEIGSRIGVSKSSIRCALIPGEREKHLERDRARAQARRSGEKTLTPIAPRKAPKPRRSRIEAVKMPPWVPLELAGAWEDAFRKSHSSEFEAARVIRALKAALASGSVK